jgi:hypothetical protein
MIYFGLLASECNKTTQKLGGLKYANWYRNFTKGNRNFP